MSRKRVFLNNAWFFATVAVGILLILNWSQASQQQRMDGLGIVIGSILAMGIEYRRLGNSVPQ